MAQTGTAALGERALRARERWAYVERAALLGDSEAQYQLALTYAARGGRQHRQAVRWFQRAARQSHLRAQVRISLLAPRKDMVPDDQKHRKFRALQDVLARRAISTSKLLVPDMVTPRWVAEMFAKRPLVEEEWQRVEGIWKRNWPTASDHALRQEAGLDDQGFWPPGAISVSRQRGGTAGRAHWRRQGRRRDG